MIFDFHLVHRLHGGRHGFTLQAFCQSRARRVAIVGASGAGKTLLLHTLAGLRRAHSEYVRINGRLYADSRQAFRLPARQRQAGLLFQDYALFPHLTVAQNIAFGRWPSVRQPPRQADAETRIWLDKMQLTHLAHHYPHQISGGQKQRTALARACIVRPHWLLLDEPFSALDAPLRAQMREQVAATQDELAIPMLLITHDPADAEVLADEVWQMENGVLQRC